MLERIKNICVSDFKTSCTGATNEVVLRNLNVTDSDRSNLEDIRNRILRKRKLHIKGIVPHQLFQFLNSVNKRSYLARCI